MRSVLVIGIGRFGKHLSMKFSEIGNEVMVVDKHEDRVRELMPYVTSAQIGDCTDESVLRALGIKNFDICFVCIGGDFQASLEITSLLKELGAKRVISKAGRDIHAKFLLRNGADEIVYPERDLAEKYAVRYSSNNLFDYIELTKDVSIYEIPPLDSWMGKSIREVNVRVKYHVSILATKVNGVISPMPPADHVFRENEHLMVLGNHSDITKILRQID
jgi:trk system potassium uptake protein TrkA